MVRIGCTNNPQMSQASIPAEPDRNVLDCTALQRVIQRSSCHVTLHLQHPASPFTTGGQEDSGLAWTPHLLGPQRHGLPSVGQAVPRSHRETGSGVGDARWNPRRAASSNNGSHKGNTRAPATAVGQRMTPTSSSPTSHTPLEGPSAAQIPGRPEVSTVVALFKGTSRTSPVPSASSVFCFTLGPSLEGPGGNSARTWPLLAAPHPSLCGPPYPPRPIRTYPDVQPRRPQESSVW